MKLDSEVKLGYLILGAIIFICLGIWLGYIFGPKLGPPSVQEDQINFRLPDPPKSPNPILENK
jgi:hypothetical protein